MSHFVNTLLKSQSFWSSAFSKRKKLSQNEILDIFRYFSESMSVVTRLMILIRHPHINMKVFFNNSVRQQVMKSISPFQLSKFLDYGDPMWPKLNQSKSYRAFFVRLPIQLLSSVQSLLPKKKSLLKKIFTKWHLKGRVL